MWVLSNLIMSEPCTSKVIVESNNPPGVITQEKDQPNFTVNLPIAKPRKKPLTSSLLTPNDIAKEILERAEKRAKLYPDGVDVLLAMKPPMPIIKREPKEEGKLDTCELLSILQDGTDIHYVDKSKPKVPRVSRGLYKDLKIDPDLEKRLALQQLMEFSSKSRKKKSIEKGIKTENVDVENNNNEGGTTPERKPSKKTVTKTTKDTKDSNEGKEPKKTPNRELAMLLQDEGAINMLYAIEKGDNEEQEKRLPSKRRMKKALIKKAQEVTEALLGGVASSGVSLRGRSSEKAEKRKLSTESVDRDRESEHEPEENDFQFTPPDSKIVRRHSSSSSYSSRGSSPRLASPPPSTAEERERLKISEKAEKLIDAKCKQLNLQPEHSQLIKKLIHDKQTVLKERLQTEFVSKIRAAINKTVLVEPKDKRGTPVKEEISGGNASALMEMVEEDWGSGSEDGGEKRSAKSNGLTPGTSSSSIVSPSNGLPSAPGSSAALQSFGTPPVTKTAAVLPSFKSNVASISPVSSALTEHHRVFIKSEELKLPREVSSSREISLTMSDGLASLCLAANTTVLPNALSTKVLRELSLALEYVSQVQDVRCIALSSEGPDFCLGFDLPELLSRELTERRALAAQAALAIKEFACKVCMVGKPLVAGVRGRAVGLGTVLLAYCDVVLAEPCASFQTPYTKLGCFPEAAASTLLPQVIGLAPTKKLLMGCAKVSCVEAESCGLVTRLVLEGKLSQEMSSVTADLLSYSNQVLASTKAVLMHGLRSKLPSVLETEVKLLQQYWISEDCQRRIATLRDNPFF